jgi:hypothetical protein
MLFEPVWVSSIGHLRAFERAYRETSYIRRLFGAYLLPNGFPYAQGSLGIPWCIPIVMFSSGRLWIADGHLEFEATKWRLPFNRSHNLRADWKFELGAEQVTATEPFEFVSPVMRYYSLPFTRVRTNVGGDLSDFLLCVGGIGPLMGKIRNRNAELRARVQDAFPEAPRRQSWAEP